MRSFFILCLFTLAFSQFATNGRRPMIQGGAPVQINGRVSSLSRLHRVEGSILKEENRELHKVHKYHLKINRKLALTIKAINMARSIVKMRSFALIDKLTKYGTRKLNHLVDLYNMAEDDYVKSQLAPIISGMKRELVKKEREVKGGISVISKSLYAILTRTMGQLEYAKRVSDANNKAAKMSLHAIGENMAKGLQDLERTRPIGTRDLRMLKHKVLQAEKKIAHELHNTNRKEITLLLNAKRIIKEMRTKAKTVINQMKHKARSDYRTIYRRASRAMMQVLLHQDNNLEKYEY